VTLIIHSTLALNIATTCDTIRFALRRFELKPIVFRCETTGRATKVVLWRCASVVKEEQTKSWPTNVIVYTDGASRGNPGPASIGIYVTDSESQVLDEYGECLGTQTNNFAEYTAVVRALEIARDRGAKSVVLRSDSELMVKQMTGLYKVKSAVIKPLHEKVMALKKHFVAVKFEHVRREFNRDADRIANEALDR
jgi:ribonuclease HI